MADKKTELAELMKKYVVENTNCIDIAKFRIENPSEYALLPHYYGSVNIALEQLGLVKLAKTKGKEGDRTTFRNRLAYDMLKDLRKKYTLEQIAEMYGVTRPAVNQLYKALETSVKLDESNS